jgi:molecular chaperone DnaK
MSYHLGIDLGTTYTAAAIHEAGRVEVVPLGDRGPSIPSVLYLKPDGNVVAGDAANRQGVTNPERIAREFKRRLGDPTPVLLGGVPTPPEVLTGRLLQSVYETVVRKQGAPPASVALTHPANWGPFKRDLFTRAAQSAGVPQATLVTEPQAAAISYATQERVEPGSVVAVYDLGGGTFDAAVLRKEPDGSFSILGTPEGIERLGGIDFDAAVFAHVQQTLEEVFEGLDPEDERAMTSVARLRQECTQAKEALSQDTEAVIPVLLPATQTEVRTARADLEDMIRVPLGETVTALERALRSANVDPAQVSHVLLVGGSSRIPLVAEMVSAKLGRPIAVDAHPKHAVALGAATVAARAAGVTVGDAAMTAAAAAPAAAAAAAGAAGRGPAPPPPPPPSDPTVPVAAEAKPPPPPSAPVNPPGGPNLAQSPAAGDQRPPPPEAARPAPPSTPTPPAGPYGTSAPPPPQTAGWDPTFDAARNEAPAPSLGYRAASLPPPPGASDNLPPGYRSREERDVVKRRQKRRSRIGVLITLVIILVVALLTFAYAAQQKEDKSLADAGVGDCVLGTDFNDVDIVGCGETHNFEVVSIIEPSDPEGDYPGQEALQDEQNMLCTAAVAEYYGGTGDALAEAGLDAYAVVPSEEQWNDGTTDTHCLAGMLDSQSTFEGTIEGQGA